MDQETHEISMRVYTLKKIVQALLLQLLLLPPSLKRVTMIIVTWKMYVPNQHRVIN